MNDIIYVGTKKLMIKIGNIVLLIVGFISLRRIVCPCHSFTGKKRETQFRMCFISLISVLELV